MQHPVHLALYAAATLTLHAQTFTTLFSFDGTDGANPYYALVQATNGNFYGTTVEGSATEVGTLFNISPAGKLTRLHNFCSEQNCADGASPEGVLVQATNGDFYGTTIWGGHAFSSICSTGCGVIFKITAGGTLTTLHEFCAAGPPCVDGEAPFGGLIQATDGNLYGTTASGGNTSGCEDGCGTIFKITPSGVFTTLHTFIATEGQRPLAPLMQATNGDLYGTASAGGARGAGTVFRITQSGELTVLYSFCTQGGDSCTDGEDPYAGLVHAPDGNLYGTTTWGGAYGYYGTVYKITPTGEFTTLYSFCPQAPACPDGYGSYGGLTIATNGNLYGTNWAGGGPASAGTIFEITPAGVLTTLYSFCSQANCPDGSTPIAGLIQGTDGNLYGTASGGGAYGQFGTVFKLSVGLDPFVETQPTIGYTGMPVKILGTDLSGATSVTFNGTAAAFEILSNSEIKATVPAGATTGTVQVVTSSGTLSSNTAFRIPAP